MPAISVKTSMTLNATTREVVKASLGKAITRIPRKSEKWLMVLFEDKVDIYLGGDKEEPSVFVEVSLFGSAQKENYDALTEEITAIFTQHAGVAPTHIYVKYAETPYWGWNGRNF